MCLPDRWIDHGTQADQLRWSGIDAQAVTEMAVKMMGKKAVASSL